MRTDLKWIIRASGAMLALASALPINAQHGSHEPPRDAQLSFPNIGQVDFATTCSPTVKDEFNRGVALLHSFWFSESRAAFERVSSADPECAMAYWGIAMTWGNSFGMRASKETIAAGKAALEQAKSIAASSAREQGYIDAVAPLFSDDDPSTQRSRMESHESAMQKLAAKHPEDIEAQIFAAFSIVQAIQPDDKTYERQLRAGAILEPLFARLPKHPGVAHYIIHAYDVPPLAHKALVAARVYADIAPAVPHALHMPSHVFTRVGAWKESAATNQRSADAANRLGDRREELHALDYMSYAYLQMGMDDEATAVLDRAIRIDGNAQGYAYTSIPARHALERQQWAEAAQLPISPYVEAISRFARAIGAARSGNPEAAAPEIARLAALRDQELETNSAYWAQVTEIQRRGALAWMLFAQGKKWEGIAELRAAADAEDATEKSAITPGPLAPAREMLGFMLLEAGNATEALKAFDTAIAKEPNRFLALYGAGKAAELAGQQERAEQYYRQIATICGDASSDRPELAHARKMAR